MKNTLIVSLLIFGFLSCKPDKPIYGTTEWKEYLGGPERNHYSPLDQVNKSNVQQLKMAWEYHTLDSGQIQCNPIIVDGVLYAMTAATTPFALDAATGKEIWKVKKEGPDTYSSSRGVSYWEDGEDKRILYSAGAFLYAVNALTGKSITTFGNNGRTDLHQGLSTNLGHDVQELSVTATSPGVIYKNTLVIGSSVSEGGDAAPGHVRAFDVATRKLKWVFHTIPQPGEVGYDT